MRSSPLVEAEIEQTALRLFARGGNSGPATLEATSRRAERILEQQYSAVAALESYGRAMGTKLLQHKPPVPSRQQSIEMANQLTDSAAGSLSALSALAVAVCRYDQKAPRQSWCFNITRRPDRSMLRQLCAAIEGSR